MLTGETPDSFTRALWQFYEQSNLVTKQEELGEQMLILPRKYLFHTHRAL
jgi:hypothetical protein